MDAVVLALASAALFGSMTVALRFALARAPDAEAGALHTIAAALAVTLPFAAAGELDLGGTWPFLLAGVLGPGGSQLLFTLAVRDAGPSRTSVTVGTAPLFSVAIALALLDEPAKAGVVLGALLIVVGGILLVREPGRPEHVKWIGLGFALRRDDHLRRPRQPRPAPLARHGRRAARSPLRATLLAGGVTVAAWLLVTRRRLPFGGFGHSSRRASSSASRTSASSRRTTAAASRSSRRSSRRSRSGASRSRPSCSAATSSSARVSSAAPRSSSRAAS